MVDDRALSNEISDNGYMFKNESVTSGDSFNLSNAFISNNYNYESRSQNKKI